MIGWYLSLLLLSFPATWLIVAVVYYRSRARYLETTVRTMQAARP
jgi:hypothetical protein